MCGNRKQSGNIQNVLGEEGLVSFCWWQIVPRVSSVCFLGGHGARQQDGVVKRGSQEETDGCSWGMLNLKRPRNPSKCVCLRFKIVKMYRGQGKELIKIKAAGTAGDHLRDASECIQCTGKEV